LTKATVGKWRKRFIERRIAGLYDDVRPGAPRTIDDERVAQLIKTTLYTKPANGSTHWSVRTVAAETGISKTSVQRYFQLFGLQPHRTESFKLSNDPFFIEKLRDVVGLYLNPPDKALVICVDEKSQCQALERTQPMLRRQLRHPQPPEDQGVAGRSAAMAHALHPYVQLLAQSGRAFLLADHRQGHSPRFVH
jgi:putative transposase